MGWFKRLRKKAENVYNDFTGITAQKKAEKRAREANAINQAAMAQENARNTEINETRNWLTGFLKERLDLKVPRFGRTNASLENAKRNANAWGADYLRQLQNAPDIAFNKGVSTLNRNTSDTLNRVRQAMSNRGISSSGINLGKIAGIEANRARGISMLQGQREDNKIRNMALGANFAGQLSNREQEDANRNYQRDVGEYELSQNQQANLINQIMRAMGLQGSNTNSLNYAHTLNNQAQEYNNLAQNAPINQIIPVVAAYATGNPDNFVARLLNPRNNKNILTKDTVARR